MAVLFKGPKRQRRKPPDDPEDFRLTLVEHLEELRDRLIRSVLILGVAWFIGWELERPLYEIMTRRMVEAITPVLPKGSTYTEAIFHTPDAFIIKMKLSFFIGLIPAFPLVVMQLWAFIEPALKPKEREPVRKIAPLSLVLFAMGALFAWWIMPAAMRWFATYVMEFPGTQVIQEVGTLAFFVLKMMLAFGIAFQLPLVVYIMGAIGLLKAETLLQYWRQAATAIFIISMIITPSNDPATMLMMAIPLVILFMISVYAVRFTQRKRKKAEAAAGVGDDLHDDFE
jgi:sec-independent protein translocase protein TatC